MNIRDEASKLKIRILLTTTPLLMIRPFIYADSPIPTPTENEIIISNLTRIESNTRLLIIIIALVVSSILCYYFWKIIIRPILRSFYNSINI